MKKALILVMVILMLSAWTYGQAKIGILDSQRLLEETKRGKAIVAGLENFGKAKQELYIKMQNDIKKLEKELMSPALNDTVKQGKAIDLDNKKMEAKRFVEDTQRELQIKRTREMESLRNDIKPIIQQIGKELGFTIIMEITVVAYYDPSADVTDEIIKRMDKK